MEKYVTIIDKTLEGFDEQLNRWASHGYVVKGFSTELVVTDKERVNYIALLELTGTPKKSRAGMSLDTRVSHG